jgi:LPXTG-motif cell wall-anchored protein
VGSDGPTTTAAVTSTTEDTSSSVDIGGPTTTAQQQSGGPTTTVPGLPRTGGDSGMLLALGLTMVMGGGIFMVLGRRNRNA